MFSQFRILHVLRFIFICYLFTDSPSYNISFLVPSAVIVQAEIFTLYSSLLKIIYKLVQDRISVDSLRVISSGI
jgi:hypothetical protein